MSNGSVRGRFVWHELMTTDTEAAQAFYGRVAGWQPQAWSQDASYTLFTAGRSPMAGLMAGESRAAGAPAGWLTYIGTPDLEETVYQAVRLGGGIVKPSSLVPGVGEAALLRDPHGAQFAVLMPTQEISGGEGPAAGDFSWHELATTDWEDALDFYSELFGWEKGAGMDMGPGLGIYQIFLFGGQPAGGMYTKPPTMGGPAAWLPYIRVADARKAAPLIDGSGGRILHGPHEVPGGDWIIQGLDPQGFLFAVHSAETVTRPAAAEPPEDLDEDDGTDEEMDSDLLSPRREERRPARSAPAPKARATSERSRVKSPTSAAKQATAKRSKEPARKAAKTTTRPIKATVRPKATARKAAKTTTRRTKASTRPAAKTTSRRPKATARRGAKTTVRRSKTTARPIAKTAARRKPAAARSAAPSRKAHASAAPKRKGSPKRGSSLTRGTAASKRKKPLRSAKPAARKARTATSKGRARKH